MGGWIAIGFTVIALVSAFWSWHAEARANRRRRQLDEEAAERSAARAAELRRIKNRAEVAEYVRLMGLGVPSRDYPGYNLGEMNEIRAFKAASHVNAGQSVALNPDGTVERAGLANPAIGVAMGEAIPGSTLPVNLVGVTRRLMFAFGPIRQGDPLYSVRDEWVGSVRENPGASRGKLIVGFSETDAIDGERVTIALVNGSLGKALPVRPVLDETAKSEIAFGFWKRALAPDYIAKQKSALPELVESLARDEIDPAEGTAIMSRYGYAPTGVLLAIVKESRFVLDALVVTLKDGRQIRLDRDLDLLRKGGYDSPMRQLLEGRAGYITKEADDAFDAVEESLE